MLLRRAPLLFAHVRDVLRRADAGSAFAADYAAALRLHLLRDPDYCARCPASVFQGTDLH